MRIEYENDNERTITETGCCTNATEYNGVNTTSTGHETIDSGNSEMVREDRRHLNRETSTSLQGRAMPTLSVLPNADEELTKSHNTDLLAISLAVLLLFLIVVLTTVSLLVLFVFWRYNKRRGGSERRWPTQKSLLSFGDNDDSASRVMSAAAAGCVKLDASSEL